MADGRDHWQREGYSLIILFYVLAIVIANVVTASFAPLTFGMLIIPWGTLFVGLTFMLRDFIQMKYGKKTAYVAIGIAFVISAISSTLLGDELWIVLASVIAFAISETADTEVFSRIKGSFSKRLLFSGIVGGILDSTIFVVVGMSPIGMNFIPWDLVMYAILGQTLVKCVLQFVGVVIINWYKRMKRRIPTLTGDK